MKIKKLAILGFLSAFGVKIFAQTPVSAKNVDIVIVHGAFASGSGWEDVKSILTGDGYNVTLVPIPLSSLAADADATKSALANRKNPVVLVGHSYGGAVITQTGGDQSVQPNIKSLVYVAAFVPDVGESLKSLNPAPDPNVSPTILHSKKGFLYVDPTQFAGAFAGDLDADTAALMAATQMPLGDPAFTDQITTAAWKANKPSFYILTTQDRMIPLTTQKMMATRAKSAQIEINASHAVYISHPAEVAQVIEKAAL